MSQPNRLKGGLIDRTQKLNFSFNGKGYEGYQGDTLASALLAGGVRLVGRSFKYHRPRGIFSCGSEEPNALVTLRDGAHAEPNTRATIAELFDGLSARSQNHIGSLSFDLMAVNDALSPLLSAGFYYKTFMWPAAFWEKVYEPIIRKAAGLGALSGKADPDIYDKGFLHCDLLVTGSGPSGLMAALVAARAGLRVIIADEDFLMGGRLNSDNMEIDGKASNDWAFGVISELASMGNVRLMPRTTIYGAYDHGVYGAIERLTDHLADGNGSARQTLWRIYSKRAVLAAGAIERSMAFGNNDRPGIMLAGAVRSYANRYATAAGKRVAIFTNNDDGWRTAHDLNARGVEVSAIIDFRDASRQQPPAGVKAYMNSRIIDTKGRLGLKSITLNTGQTIPADCLAVSGGWSPTVHLSSHMRGRPLWNETIAGFVPGTELPPGMTVAGAANGSMTLRACLEDGLRAGREVARDLGKEVGETQSPVAEDESFAIKPFWHVKESKKRAWLDLQNDITAKDVVQSHLEGFRSVEHLKRYTTLGMATDQGKTANIPALAVLADLSGKSMSETGTTIFRPPYTPVPIGAFAGRSRGKDFRPTRLPPSHGVAKKLGAVFVEAGAWMRAQWFPQAGETQWRQSVDREVLAVRASVGICDVSTLGKIDIQGPDAAVFLNRVYANGFAKLAVGKTRYGLMLREDGMVMDDGTTARLGEHHYLMTTTTANAGSVFRHLEFCRQALWPDLDVHLISVTDQYAQIAVAGPNARRLLERLMDADMDISSDGFPFMACGEITICGGVPARLFRISFSGELAYEIAVPARYGESLFATLLEAGAEFGIVPYGTEALGVMRIEKGHAAGNELNGQTTALMLGMGRMVSSKKDCIGNILSRRPELTKEDDLRLVGFKPLKQGEKFSAGSHFIAIGAEATAANDEGWMTSVCYSPVFETYLGLGFIKSGDARIGEQIRAVDLLRGKDIEVEIVSPHFYDPEGGRQRD